MKPKVITKDLLLPDWVNWIAQDKDGKFWGYEIHPIRISGTMPGWITLGWKAKFICQGPPNPNWQDTLEHVGDKTDDR